MKDRYVVVTPARDEEETIGRTIASMVAQRVRPVRWVIVDDGSTDGTAALVEREAAGHDWIELVRRGDRGRRALGGGVVEAFDAGLERLSGMEWDFVVKLDADLSFDADYFERLLQRFDANPRLGMASGKTFLPAAGGQRKLEWCHDEHVRGPAKMYARPCFEAIGGLEPVRGWDMIDETRAQMAGYETRSYLDLPLLHHRPIDARQSHVLRSRFEMGRVYHRLGYHWLYHTVRSARSAAQDFPILLGGLMLWAGYAWAALSRAPRYDADYVAFVQRKQRERINLAHLGRYLGSLSRGSR